VIYLAEAAPGSHPLVPICGDQAVNLLVLNFYYCAITPDTLVSSGIAIVVTLALIYAIVFRISRGVPGKLQWVLEAFLNYTRTLVAQNVESGARFIIPLAATIFLYILVANWLDFFPLPGGLIHPANADLNQTLAMAVLVIVLVQWYSFRVLGFKGYFRRYTKPFDMPRAFRFFPLWIALNVIEELAKPITLSLRLFGNIFAGALMVFLLGLAAGAGGLWIGFSLLGLVIWKLFDVLLIGTIQALIFFLLTIVYFGMAREGIEEVHEPAHGRVVRGHPPLPQLEERA
jgi:F-type H+-transporting ATPase subunit a